MQVRVQGHDVHVTTAGNGPPALFLHGVPDTAELWHDVVAGAAARFSCFAPDFQGLHRSRRNPSFDYSFAGYANWVEDLVTALGLSQPIHLVVHDWGGLIGLAWACRNPQRLASVLVLNSVFDPRYRGHLLALLWRTPGVGELVMRLLSKPWVLARGLRGSGHASNAVDTGFPAFATADSRDVILQLYRSADMPALAEWRPAFEALARQVPVEVLWGLPDPYIPKWVAGTFCTERVSFIGGAGHWVPLRAPERVVAALGSRLAR